MDKVNIVLQIKKSDRALFDSAAKHSQLETVVMESRGIDGSHEILSILLGLTTTSIPAIAALIIAHIRSKRYLKIVVDGIEITGVSEKNASKLLEQILQEKETHRGKRKSP